jgi:hypothetical protein
VTGDSGDGDRTDRQEEFLSSWKRSMLGGRPSVGVPRRGLRGVAVMVGTVAIVVGVVLGGVAVVNTVAGHDGGGSSSSSDNAALTSVNLATATPEEPAPSATEKPEKAKHKQRRRRPNRSGPAS